MSSITLNIQGSSSKFSVQASPEDTVLVLKELVLQKLDDKSVKVDQLRLIFAGQILKNDKRLTDYNLADGLTIHLVKSAKPSGTPSNPATAEAPRSGAEGGEAADPSSPQMPPLTAFAAPGLFPGMHLPGPTGMLPGGQVNADQLRHALELMRSNPALYEQMMRMTPGFGNFPPEMQQMLLQPERLDQILSMMIDPVTGQLRLPASGELMLPQVAAPSPAPMQPQEPPEVRFQSQLQQLSDMGFWDAQANIEALLKAGGNVNAAVEYLLSNLPG